MSLPRVVLFCPGRGAYGRAELGFIGDHRRPGPVADVLQVADSLQESGETITELDALERFRPGLHLDGVNAAELIYFGTMFHAEHLRERYDIVAVAGNSLGWYTALAASGAVDPGEGWKLVQSMAQLQGEVRGGQVLTTVVDEDWWPDPEARAELDQALAATNAKGEEYFIAPSIYLGGHEVLGGTDKGVAHLLENLTKRKLGKREYPIQLAGNGPFHTPLCQATSEAAKDRLADLRLRRPQTHLIDGLGRVHSPWSSSPSDILDYTLSTQVLRTFDFTACVRTALREFNPDVLLCAGPGSSLRAPVGHVVLAEGFRGVRDQQGLFAAELVAVN